MIKFISEHSGMLFAKTFEHLYISIVALVIAMIVAVPLGILLSKKEKLSKVSLTIAGVLQTIPTLAVLALMIPLFISAFQRAEELAIAMEVRGYDINIKRTSYRLLHWQYKDTLTVLLLIPIATILFILKFSGV